MRLIWSIVAKAELRELSRYSIKRWGREVAAIYLTDVRNAARTLAADHRVAKPLKHGFGSHRVRSHHLIVLLDKPANALIVARVLHSAMDLDRHLP